MANNSQLTELTYNFLKNNSTYDFFQLLRLLEQCHGKDLFKTVKLLSSSQLTFPAADLNLASFDPFQQIHLELNFMGFYGLDSPLPQYFSVLVNEGDEPKILKDFLSIFNRRLYQLLYYAYKKHKSLMQLEGQDFRYLEYLIALSGYGLDKNDLDEFAFAGLMGAKHRTKEGLLGLLKDYLALDSVIIHSFALCWLPLNNKAMLGRDRLSLGEDTLLGEKVLDINSKISIQIGPLAPHQAEELLPGNAKGGRLQSLIKRYLGPLLSFDLQLEIDAANSECLVLAENKLQLGWMLNLGAISKKTETVTFYCG